jgi:GNAT superfamily N-acetyltransferase
MSTDPAAVRLRTGTYHDIANVLKLWREAETAPSTTDDPDGLNLLLAAAPSSLVIAEYQAQIVGTLIATFDGWRGNLYRLAVQPAHRRRGVARSLVIEGEHRLRSAGARRITALIATNSTAPKSSGGRLRFRSAHHQVRQDAFLIRAPARGRCAVPGYSEVPTRCRSVASFGRRRYRAERRIRRADSSEHPPAGSARHSGYRQSRRAAVSAGRRRRSRSDGQSFGGDHR